MIVYPPKVLSEYYLTEEIYVGALTLVYRVFSLSPVILNLLRQEYLTFNNLILFRN